MISSIMINSVDEHKKSFAHVIRANEFGNWIMRCYMKYAVLGMCCVVLFELVGCMSFSLIVDGYLNEKYFIYPGQFR